MSSIRANLEAVERRIRAACERARRPRESVRLLAVTKFHPVERLRELYDLGERHFAENRVQELHEKAPQLPRDIEWHLIGQLQTNKAKYLPGLAHWVHSVDRQEVAEGLERAAARANARLSCLIEVNVASEAQKGGVAPAEAENLVRLAAAQPHLDVQGFMAMAPFDDHAEHARPVFRALRELAERARATTGIALPHLSMGMTQDFEVAIEEGATMIRIGTAIMGERQ